MKKNKWKITWANGSEIAQGKTLIQAVKNMKIKQKNIELGILVSVYNNGVVSYWNSERFANFANLVSAK